MKAKHFKLPIILNIVLSLFFFGCSVKETNLENENSQTNNRGLQNSSSLNRPLSDTYDFYIEYYVGEEVPRGESYEGLIDDLREHMTIYNDVESRPCKSIHKLTVDIRDFEEYFGVEAYREDCGCTTGHGMKKPEPDPDPDEEDAEFRHNVHVIDLSDYRDCF